MNTRDLVRESVALLLMGMVAALVLALVSYTPADPSLNHQTSAPVSNMVGVVGAYAADLLYQLFGYAAWIWVLLLALVALRMAWGKRPYLGRWTSLFWLPLVLAVAALLDAHLDAALDIQKLAEKPAAGVGGALGAMFATVLTHAFHAIGRDVLLTTLAISSFVTASRWSLVMLVKRLAVLLGGLLRAGWRSLSRLRETLSSRKERLQGREERRQMRLQHPQYIVESEVEVGDPPRVEISKRARQERQVEMALPAPDRGSHFKLPSLSLFDQPKTDQKQHQPEALQALARMLEKKLLDYRVEGRVVSVQPGPVVTQFEFEPAPGTKVGRVIALQDDLARAMAAVSVRVAGNIPGKNAIGIELPNDSREMVMLAQVLASKEFADKRKTLPLAFGVDIAGRPVVADLAKMPHLLVAGTTGSGKSVSINAMICSLLMTHTPEELRLILVDPKMLELSVYDDIPHLLVPVVTEPRKAAKALAWAVYEMERRYRLMSEAKVRNIEGYNKAVAKQPDGEAEHLPYIVIIIDELADLMMVAGKEVEQAICRIAQKARAAGLHLILATQRPSVDVITGLIKANLPSRLAFQVSSKVDSRTILDQMGAEQLLGAGDSLFLSGGRDLKRVHGAFVSDEEVLRLVEYLKAQGEPDYREEVFMAPAESANGEAAPEGAEEDAKYDEAVALVVEKGSCSVSMVQRYLRIGYNRASRIVEEMERQGVVTPPGPGGIRKVLVRSQQEGGGVIE